MRTLHVLALIAAIAVAACAQPAPTPSPSPIVAAPSPMATAAVSASPVAARPRATCPPAAFDDTAELVPAFSNDIFLADESETITAAFLDRLAAYYARPSESAACALFTDRGLVSARAHDPRFLAAEQGRQLIEGSLILRIAFEADQYDLRQRPPVVPIDAIFDIDAGATITDLATGTTASPRPRPARDGLHFDLVFDGHTWRADDVGAVSAENIQLGDRTGTGRARRALHGLPSRSTGRAVRRSRGDPFDTPLTAARAGPGATTTVAAGSSSRASQLVLLTRFPCDRGHAAILSIGRPLGSRLDPLVRWEYVRDPEGEFEANGWSERRRMTVRATLPGRRGRYGVDEREHRAPRGPTRRRTDAIYVVRGETVERWPRAADQWGVTDCN